MEKKSYIFSLDVIRVIAIIGVVAIHTVNAVHARPDFVGGGTWWIANVLESVSRASIPLFILISGYLILGKKESFTKTLNRTFYRIIIPLIVFLVLYLVWNGGSPSFNGLNTFFSRLYSGGVFHLYFLVIMVGLYMVAPLLRLFLQAISAGAQKYTTVILLVLGCGIVAGQYYFNQCSLTNSLIMWVPFVGYFVGGYVLGSKSSFPHKKYLWALFGLSLAATMTFNFYHLSLVKSGIGSLQPEGCISPYFDNYLSPNVIIMSIAVYLILIQTKFEFVKSKKNRLLIHSLARSSFGIYLIHILIIELLEHRFNFIVDVYPYPLLSFIMLKWGIVFVVSYLLVLILTRIPFVKMAFGER